MKTKLTLTLFGLLFSFLSYAQNPNTFHFGINYVNINYSATGYWDVKQYDNSTYRLMNGTTQITSSSQINGTYYCRGMVQASFQIQFQSGPSLSISFNANTPSGILAQTTSGGRTYIVEYTKELVGYRIKAYYK